MEIIKKVFRFSLQQINLIIYTAFLKQNIIQYLLEFINFCSSGAKLRRKYLFTKQPLMKKKMVHYHCIRLERTTTDTDVVQHTRYTA